MTFVKNIVNDLWDKRLLPVVVLLLVAAAAIPLLLLKGEKQQPVAQITSTGVSKPVEPPTADESIITIDEQLNKRKRLDAFKKKDPFVQKALKSDESGSGSESGSESGSVVPTDSGAGGDGSAPATGGNDSTSGGNTDAKDKSNGDSSPADSGTELFERTVTVRFGLLGNKFESDDKVKKNLAAVSPLPSSENPVLMYMGVSANSPSAVFFVDHGVVVTGEGTCMPDKTNCSYLYLREKTSRNEATLYRKSDPERKYGIRLKEINVTEVSESSSTSSESSK